jgi:glycosyltransferase involved in cell wall biosynthesis
MLREGLVSTIIPVFNRPALLREAVESVLAQTYRPIEIVIVDDGSTDDTSQSGATLAAGYPDIVRLLRIPNGGPGAAREAGRLVAEGEFIQYLDSDDLLLPRKFELQVGGLRAHPECDVGYGITRFYSIGEAPGNVLWKRTGERIETMFPSFLQSRWWDTSTPLYRRKVIDRAGEWLRLRNEEDWEYDCRVASHSIRLHFSPEYVSDTRTHGGDMLSRGGRNAAKLRDRAEAHRLIFGHAQRAGIAQDTAEMKHFARALFLLSRQCGAAGLSAEARMLFDRACNASTPERKRGMDFMAYHTAASVLGWSLAGRLSCGLDMLRRWLPH